MQVNERTGMTFARGLRAVLRQDPDVVLVGEVRDAETAELALRAVADRSPGAHDAAHATTRRPRVTRLVDMGVEPYLVASSLALVVAQRLVRRPCLECCRAGRPAGEVLADLGIDRRAHRRWVRAVGRARLLRRPATAAGTARARDARGRSPGASAALLDGGGEEGVRRAAREAGTESLLAHAVRVARRGDTTLAEVLRAVPAATTTCRPRPERDASRRPAAGAPASCVRGCDVASRRMTGPLLDLVDAALATVEDPEIHRPDHRARRW